MYNLLLAFVIAGSPDMPPWQYGGFYASKAACENAAQSLKSLQQTTYWVCVNHETGLPDRPKGIQ